jgi:hypothetical protein
VKNEEGPVDSFEVNIEGKKVLIIPEAGTTARELKAAIQFCSKVI